MLYELTFTFPVIYVCVVEWFAGVSACNLSISLAVHVRSGLTVCSAGTARSSRDVCHGLPLHSQTLH